MQEKEITVIPVVKTVEEVDNQSFSTKKVIGIVHMHDLLKAGIV